VLTVSRPDPDSGRSDIAVSGLALDVVFPVLHGPYGEDGTVQGLLELANVPYVGAGVLASAVGMDKAAMKLVFAAKGLPICDYEVVLKRDWLRDERSVLQTVITRLGFPVFVKPANLGSSVGISKAKHTAELRTAIALAAQFDRKIVIEAAVPLAREIEVAVLGNDDPEASVPGEIIPAGEFYDYQAKLRERRLARRDTGGDRRGPHDGSTRDGRRRIQGDRRRRHGARRLSARGRQPGALPERSEHHPRLHHDQHVLEDVGRERAAVRAVARSFDRARDSNDTPRSSQLRTSM